MQVKNEMELWGGIECTLNRVNDDYHDQLKYTGHYYRKDDIDTVATLGIKALRYPVLWEHHQPQKGGAINWSFAERNLVRLKSLGIQPIVGLVHHGSGPRHVNFFDGSFDAGLASYASSVAEKFPWIEYYTPVNEPLTTARFCGLYGHWYPHTSDEHSFYTILLSECRATVKAMQAIRRINPNAKLVQTEDLGKSYSTPLLRYQAQYDNQRRWLTFDLLCGRVNEQHPLWHHLTTVANIPAPDLHWFLHNNCPPDICGLNYYMTSERYLDEEVDKYPTNYHSGNGKHPFADVERVRVDLEEASGLKLLLKEACQYLQLPIAITECHLHCTRDEQMRWFEQIWQIAQELRTEGVDIRAVTAWALFGTYGWDKLMMEPMGTYETGAFKVTNGWPVPTAFAKLLKKLSAGQRFQHPLLVHKGWWQRDIRLFYGILEAVPVEDDVLENPGNPLLIFGKNGILSEGFRHVCYERNIPFIFIEETLQNGTNIREVNHLLRQYDPWAVVRIEDYQDKRANSAFFNANDTTCLLAAACKRSDIKLTIFAPEPDRKGVGSLHSLTQQSSDNLQIYEAVFTEKEKAVLSINQDTLFLRTGRLFSPWDETNPLNKAMENLQQDQVVEVSDAACSSFAYVPDVIHIGLDWLLDGETGVHYMANSYHVSQLYLLAKAARLLGKNLDLLDVIPAPKKAQKHFVQLLPINRRIKLPYLEDALQRYVETVKELKQKEELIPV